jgi:IS5 family transposase
MRQQGLAECGFEKYRKVTRRERFLAEMNEAIPWAQLAKAIAPYYPAPKGAGRRPVGIERMLRMHFLQHWFNLSDPAVEEALYESRSMCRFVGIDLGREPVPDETTVLKFRHLLEAHNLGAELFALINDYLQEQGLAVGTGTIVDATIINAPSSTKNRERARDPEMHQTRKGNQWYFGMKAHIGVDSKTRLIHTVTATAANVHDSREIEDLLHGEETRVWADSAYTGQRERIRKRAPQASDFTNKRGARGHPLSDQDKEKNRTKSKVRAKVEHPFHILKCVFGYRKVRYRGIDKNANRLFVSFGLVNLYLARRKLVGFP